MFFLIRSVGRFEFWLWSFSNRVRAFTSLNESTAFYPNTRILYRGRLAPHHHEARFLMASVPFPNSPHPPRFVGAASFIRLFFCLNLRSCLTGIK